MNTSKRQLKHRPQFQPNPEQLATWPKDISGNGINGLGETESRRPTPIMWHDPDILAHGELQKWFWAQGAKAPEMAEKRAERQKLIDAGSPPVAENPDVSPLTPQQAHDEIHRVAREAGADIVGIARLDPEWVFEGYECEYPTVIILGAVMDHDKLSKAPEIEAGLEVVDKYARGWVIGRPLEAWLRERGHDALCHGGPMAGPVNMLPAALACGFGELGKHGSLINREFGSSFRLSMVLTDIPTTYDSVDEFAADDFCMGCQVCTNACPVDAISDLKQLVRGAEKWYVDFDRCFTYFAETYGCAICIAVCPWSFPERAPKLAEKWTRRRQRKQAEAVLAESPG